MASFQIKSRNGTFYVFWTDEHGKLQRKSTLCRDASEAKIRAAQIVNGQWKAPTSHRERSRISGKPTAETVTMAHLFDRCERTIWTEAHIKSVKTVRSAINVLNPIIGEVRVKDMTYDRLEQLVATLRATKKGRGGRNYSEGAVSRKMNVVSKSLKQACKLRDDFGNLYLITPPPMPVIPLDNFQDRELKPLEEAAVFKAIAARAEREPNRDWVRYSYMIRFMLDTGARLGSVLGVRVTDISEPREVNGVMHTFVTFHTTKSKLGENGKAYTLPLTPAVIEVLPLLKAMATNGRLFPFTNAWDRWNRCVRADLADMGFNIADVKLHTLRHTCIAAKARRSGKKGDIFKIATWANHSNPAITMKRYGKLLADDMVDML